MKNIFFVIVMVFSTLAIAQTTIEGIVVNQENLPLPNVTIYIPNLEKGTITDLDGTFKINNIPKGNLNLVFSSLGFTTYSKKINLTDNETVTFNIILEESAVEMQEIVLSTPFHKLQRDNVMKVERASAVALEKQGATTLAEGITNIAGVSSISTGTGIGKPVIRGLSANRVLTYAQGVRLENQQFGDEHGLGINSAGIASVEVIKGPASLLYGSDAIGGVLYLNPENFAKKNATEASLKSAYFSNTNGTQTSLGIKTSLDKFKFLVRGTYTLHGDYETGGDYKVTNSRFNEKDLKAGLRYQTTQLSSTLRYNYNRANIGIPEDIGAQNNNTTLLTPYQEIDNHLLSWENKLFFNNSNLNIKLGYQFNDRREFAQEEPEAPIALELQLKLNTLNYDIKYELAKFGNFETIIGVQGLYQTNKNFGEEVLIPDATTFDFGVFGTTHYHFEKADIQAGLRFDTRAIDSEPNGSLGEEGYINSLSRNFTSVNAALGSKIDVTKKIDARINLATGFRAPNLAELTSNGVHEGTNRYEIGNSNLGNEQNFQADVALEYQNDHFEVFSNGFYNAIKDYIFISPTGELIDNNQVFNYVQNDAKLYGGEFGLHLHPHPLDWLHLESSFETVTGRLENDHNLPLIPANTLKNTLRAEFETYKKLKDIYTFIKLSNIFNQNSFSTFETRTGGYSLLDLGFGSTLKTNTLDYNFGFTITNIFDKAYVAHLSRLKTDAILNPGRNINLRILVSL